MSDLASTSEKDGGLDPAGVEAVRAWYLGHTGKMITRSNARKAILAYLSALASPAPAESGEPRKEGGDK